MTTQTTALVCPDYIVRVSAAKMPSKCWGRYVHVAVLEVDPGVQSVSAIDTRVRGVRRIVSYEGRQHVGSTDRSAAAKAEERALVLCERLRISARRDYHAAVDAAVAESLAARTDEI